MCREYTEGGIIQSHLVGIIDYGAGNIGSITNALNYLQIDNKLIRSPEDLEAYSKVILPGVGSFKSAMKLLQDRKLDNAIKEFVSVPSNKLLGICLGMQLLYDSSEEDGGYPGLGLIKGGVTRLSDTNGLKVPNVGWRAVRRNQEGGLYQNIDSDLVFYFVHSYACRTEERSIITGTADHNGDFSCSIEQKNIFAVQFHPEKSQKCGLKLLSNFSDLP